MVSQSRFTGLGIALGAALGTALGVMAGHVAIWLSVGVAIGLALGASLRNKPGRCQECAMIHQKHEVGGGVERSSSEGQ